MLTLQLLVPAAIGTLIGGALGASIVKLRDPEEQTNAVQGMAFAALAWIVIIPYFPALFLAGYIHGHLPEATDGGQSLLEISIVVGLVTMNAFALAYSVVWYGRGDEREFRAQLKAKAEREAEASAKKLVDPPFGQRPTDLPPPTLPPEGWYRDPVEPSRLRFWDGESWSSHTQESPPATKQD